MLKPSSLRDGSPGTLRSGCGRAGAPRARLT